MFSNEDGYPVVDDAFAANLAAAARSEPNRFGGYVVRDFAAAPFGSYSEVSTDALIPRNEWRERAQALEAARATPEHVAEFARVPILNQGRRPYCWAYGAMGVLMVGYAAAGLPVPHLSATSLAAKIKHYRDVGGWAGEAIEGNQRFGCSTIEFWPEADLNPAHDTPDQRANAALHIATEWAELAPRSFDAAASQLLRGRAVTLGLAWWGHLIYATKLVILQNGGYGMLIRNSWGREWEREGRAILPEAKATPDEAYIIRSVSKYTKGGPS
jgi:hypothetical protein